MWGRGERRGSLLTGDQEAPQSWKTMSQRSDLHSATNWLCDLGKITSSL